MATRSIARTAIEGGRAKHNRQAEREAHRSERRVYQRYCHMAVLDPEMDEPANNEFADPWMVGRKLREFSDKLSPVKRWLESRVGTRWDGIHSEVVKKFNSNTLAGRHILEHVRGFVTMPEDKFKYSRWYYRGNKYYPGELYLDDDRVLQLEPYISRSRYYRGG